MTPTIPSLPTAETIHQAIAIYLRHAWITPLSEPAAALCPPEGDFDVAGWVMGDMIERDPASAGIDELRSVAVRLGNTFYPNMKFRMSLPPGGSEYLFSVDCHDAVLVAPEGSADYAMLEELKANNKTLSETIQGEWDAAGLPTEKNYMRRMIEQARRERQD